jgi:hypothetical protein
MLKDMTNGLLVGHIKRFGGANYEDFAIRLSIVAPALENYSYPVLVVSYQLEALYPVIFKEPEKIECQSEEEFVQELEKILSSEKIQRVVAALLGQIQIESNVDEKAILDAYAVPTKK